MASDDRSSGINERALNGFKDATSYDQNRPSYPPEAVTNILEAAGVKGVEGARILDLAAGTGKFTELLAARRREGEGDGEGEGLEVVAVEPVAKMRRELEAKRLAGVTARDGLATRMGGVEDGWADAVVAAQSFHW